MASHLVDVDEVHQDDGSIYVDGIASNPIVSTDAIVDILPSAVANGFLGRKGDNNQYFIGSMDEVWVHGVRLDQQQVINLRDFNNILPSSLELVVDNSNGQMIIRNKATNADPLSLSSYEITSASGGLDVASWSRLATQNAPGFPSATVGQRVGGDAARQ